MKKFLILLVILAGVAIFFFSRNTPVEVTEENTSTQTGSFNPDPSNATFTFNNEEEITLSEGRRVTNSGEETVILDQTGHGDINNDGKEDTALFLARVGGGSGVFIHVAAYVSGPINYKGTNTIFIGDRVAPESITISNGVITATYLDRAEDEPFAAEPTVSTTKEFVYRNGSLEER